MGGVLRYAKNTLNGNKDIMPKNIGSVIELVFYTGHTSKFDYRTQRRENKTMANNTISIKNGIMAVTFTEKKGKALDNYEMYTEGIKALTEVGRVATLKIVEAVARVNTSQLWKLGNSEKTGLPYTSINEWAITEFGYSKSHVSEMLSVAKQCCDIETGAPLECLAGYSYTQLLAFTKNPKLLLKVKAGETPDGISLATTAKEIKNFGVKTIEDKGGDSDGKGSDSKDEKQGENKQESDNKESTDNGKTENGGADSGKQSEKRTLTMEMSTFTKWYNMLSDALGKADSAGLSALEDAVGDLLNEWNTIVGNPFE